MISLWKIKPVRDKDYLNFISSLPCIICGKEAVAHHEQLKGHGAKGSKCDDTRSYPLCMGCHDLRHRLGRVSFAKQFNIDYEMVIKRLGEIWKEYNLQRS